jgi:galacturonosyltransferase
LIGLIDDETLYFLQTGRYSKLASFLIRYSINNYDAFICVGNFEAKLIKNVLKNEKPIKVIYNGVEDNRALRLSKIQPNFSSKKILFIGSILSENRAYYKGLKFLLNNFEKMLSIDPDLELNILGDITEQLKTKYLLPINTVAKSRIFFRGNVNNIEDYLKDTLFYLHCSNGESWGISVQEAMFSGVIPFVSDLTGVNQVVKVVSDDLVFKAEDSNELLFKVNKFLNLSFEEKQALSERCRDVVKEYTSSNAVLNFKYSFYELANG